MSYRRGTPRTVRSPRGALFRQWATAHLEEYLVKGFTMDDQRLKQSGGGDYFDELLARIRDIRASERPLEPVEISGRVAQLVQKKKVTAWVCAADHQAYPLIYDLQMRGLRVPEDCSVTGYDGIAPPALKPFGSAKGKWVPDFVKNFAIQPWPATISSTLGELDYQEGTHSVLAPDQDSLPRTWTHTYSANLNHALSMDWPLLDFAKFTFSEKSTRLWNDSIEAPHFDPSTGMIGAWPLIFDWDTTRVSRPGDTLYGQAHDPNKSRQQFGLLRNESGRLSDNPILSHDLAATNLS